MKHSAVVSDTYETSVLLEYLVDAGQRTILFWDVLRQRGNQYLEHLAAPAPHVLKFDFEVVLDGHTFPEPVNYALVKIIPPEGVTIDERKRPFIIVDPRGGHGPGIGGFKADSEIGVALNVGHPCYFIGFTPKAVEGQTIEAIVRAEATFVEKVNELHAHAEGKPVLIGNCQAGWSLMMLAAMRPELSGPIILAGSPLSYWAGVRGANPMRYLGGVVGGSWVTAMASDVGNGEFDSAWLVQNFENLNPAHTYWNKQYRLYANIDVETDRYLGFERWWGGHVLFTGEEMQYIVDNLFIGNKLSTSRIISSDGIKIDIRHIRSPIICFCSKGDNITPPQQALGWILDLYHSVDDIIASGQTIVYNVHETTGHLGIFVSGNVVSKEHTEFTSNIDFIDCLPPGLYEAVFDEKTSKSKSFDLIKGNHISRYENRTLDDIRALGVNSFEEERCFAASHKLSQVTHGLYRMTAQPVVRSMVNEQTAEAVRRAHPLRVGYEAFSDQNPVMTVVASMADWVRENRQPVSKENPFLEMQNFCSDCITLSLNSLRDWRDIMTEIIFFGVYNQPWLQAMLGLRATDDPPRQHPGLTPDHLAVVKRKMEDLYSRIDQGGLLEAALRGLIFVNNPQQRFDEREFAMLSQMRNELGEGTCLEEFKSVFREQYYMLLVDQRRALDAIPKMLKGHEKEGPVLLDAIRRILSADGYMPEESERCLDEIRHLFFAGE